MTVRSDTVLEASGCDDECVDALLVAMIICSWIASSEGWAEARPLTRLRRELLLRCCSVGRGGIDVELLVLRRGDAVRVEADW